MAKTLKIKMVKSMIGRPEKQRKILRGLGLRKISQEVECEANPAVIGMIQAVKHLVTAEEK
ncbi:MAG: 50S ribosomal protein L30 [Desulfobacterales bacterium]|jgi:large subunit ribosomal protein L30|nr:50S ribosomal protein L30 [Desulfobacterales bacterium]